MTQISLDKILPNPEQPRNRIVQDDIEGLADSIRMHGLINPISVESAGDFFILIDGERRVRAARLAGLEYIEAYIRPQTDGKVQKDRLVLALVGNMQRENMNAIEKGHAFTRLREMGLSVHDISRQIGVSDATVYMCLNILELEPEIQDLYAEKLLPIDTKSIAAIRRLPEESRVRIARSLAANNASAKTVLQVCHRIGVGPERRRREQKASPAPGTWNMTMMIDWPVPDHLSDAAKAACKKCILYEHAGYRTCQDCPGIDLLRIITRPATRPRRSMAAFSATPEPTPDGTET